MKNAIGILAAITAVTTGVCVTAKMVKTAKQNNIKKHYFTIDALQSHRPAVIFFISDTHRRLISDTLLAQVKQEKPDVIMIGGDLAEKGVPYARIEENLKRLTAIAPVFFVWGNNDHELHQQKLKDLLHAYDVRALQNETTVWHFEGQPIKIGGIDDIRLEKADYEAIRPEFIKEEVNILLSHNPDVHHIMSEEEGIDLVLSGHTHGGQIRIGKFGPYEKGGTGLIKGAYYLISNGYGTTKIPMRLGAEPETHLIYLMPLKTH
ncbi:metallophosphoesterase [Bacillus sp. 179-C3.3 HS]|uniref:metallophosphoesterase n=1 Tax=Bacillus sp. 179-C3.3 HS TaxID=3232162 RepID=UPI0039A1A54D